jgi:hypothetical protein
LEDSSQTKLQIWGENSQDVINQQKISILMLGREVFNLETEILSWQEQLNSVGRVFKYTPMTLTVAEAAGGRDGQTVYNPWS